MKRKCTNTSRTIDGTCLIFVIPLADDSRKIRTYKREWKLRHSQMNHLHVHTCIHTCMIRVTVKSTNYVRLDKNLYFYYLSVTCTDPNVSLTARGEKNRLNPTRSPIVWPDYSWSSEGGRCTRLKQRTFLGIVFTKKCTTNMLAEKVRTSVKIGSLFYLSVSFEFFLRVIYKSWRWVERRGYPPTVVDHTPPLTAIITRRDRKKVSDFLRGTLNDE